MNVLRKKNVMQKHYWGVLFFLLAAINSYAQKNIALSEAYLLNDTLVVRNSVLEQKWSWNEGDISLSSIKELNSGDILYWDATSPSFALEGNDFTKNIDFRIQEVDQTVLMPEHLEIHLENQYGQLYCKRILRVFPDVAAVSCDYYLKYESLSAEQDERKDNLDGTEETIVNALKNSKSYLASLGFSSKHVKLELVDFKDATDAHDNLVFTKEILPYRSRQKMTGNLILGEELVSENQFFILKEAPNSKSQINYPGYDFVVSQRGIELPFSGFPITGSQDGWIKGYTLTVGFSGAGEDCLFSLRDYLKRSINYDPEQHEMVMMNTWGDRGRDGKISESFVLEEIEKAQKLGISHFQIDDGWQQGLSANSIHESGNLWDAWSPESWQPNKDRFPNGLSRILKSAKEKGIRLGLWFHPSNESSYATWETDADILINLYQETGISYFKIDGVEIADKKAAVNLEKLFSRVKEETNGAVFFNLDLTAGIRGGYFSYRPFGNLFLENRYTDWGNYYPFRTLRNVWQLSRYFPPELLQIEFLNKWRNQDKYLHSDPFAPSNYDFEYLFAITMVGQPLAWFEATGLPEEALELSTTIEKFKEIQEDFHSGCIFPIGEEPSGRSWTGFQSILEGGGYFLIFRENTDRERARIKTFLPKNKRIRLTNIIGGGDKESTVQMVSVNNELIFELPTENSYTLYKYDIE